MTKHDAAAKANAFRPGRKLQIMTGTRTDPYQARRKPPSPSVCPICRLVFAEGRWQRGDAPAGANEEICPACRRIKENFPAGWLTVEGPWAMEHREEVLRTARNFAERMEEEHPLQRMIGIDESPEKMTISTTDIHLAQGIGRALHRAYHGNLHFTFTENEYVVRVNWVC